MGAEAGKLLKEHEAAERLGICERTLRKERQAGRLPYIKFGRAIRYAPADIEAFIESARLCQSIAERVPRSGGTRSHSTVVDFEEARARRPNGQRRK